ncbi:aspartate/glutamate racemase family protein [Mesorhizobium sp. M5C.F.Cr.IN.023.01.1.1]|uniref:maleate cis-trans isomerase family protein n=1 Tax=Mesorhizobium sp. M5C.F.Cr.IN.023.01.1.1 TaxID=2496768 RepID=UPI0013E3B49C|nr:aspartate/glutamate racemase family protein [Mesorhizobium sp. M5C.F.Cr.IN.023.01.1.1]
MNQSHQTLIFDGRTEPSRVVVRIGLILISSDEVGGDAFSSIMPKGDVLVFSTRSDASFPSDGSITFATSLAEVANTLPPPGRFDVLAFSCTSGSLKLGVESLLSQLRWARPGLKYTSPAIAAIAALNELRAKRIALLTPYEMECHQLFPAFFTEHGFEIVADGTFAKHTDAEIGEISQDAIFSAANKLVAVSSPDALFVSCTATPIVPHIARLEKELGIPVVSSSQAMAWHALRLADYQKPIHGFGQLLAQLGEGQSFST